LLFTSSSANDLASYGGVSPIVFPLATALFRVDYLTGGTLGVPRPEVSSLMQLNYQVLATGTIRDRAGTSPGVIASFDYVFPFPLNIILCVAYLGIVARLANVLLSQRRGETLSAGGIVLLLLSLGALFQSPFDLLALADDAAVKVLLLLGLCLAQTSPGVASRTALPSPIPAGDQVRINPA